MYLHGLFVNIQSHVFDNQLIGHRETIEYSSTSFDFTRWLPTSFIPYFMSSFTTKMNYSLEYFLFKNLCMSTYNNCWTGKWSQIWLDDASPFEVNVVHIVIQIITLYKHWTNLTGCKYKMLHSNSPLPRTNNISSYFTNSYKHHPWTGSI